MHIPPMPTWGLVCLWLTFSTIVAQRLPVDGGKGLADVLLQSEDRCKLDFVNKFLRLLSSPPNGEPDEHLMSIFKLLSDSEHSDSTNTDIEKRLKPEFNPTGWRRKRDLRNMPAMKRVLQALYDSLATHQAPDTPLSTWHKRNARNRLLNIIPKPKRKPLEFNPTGW